jgi:hypothetical protein
MALVQTGKGFLLLSKRRFSVADPSLSSSLPFASTSQPSPFGLALVRASDGDATIRDMLLAMAWDRYRAAGFPCGSDEAGMERWWNQRLAAWTN